jgi:hypothetical protein
MREGREGREAGDIDALFAVLDAIVAASRQVVLFERSPCTLHS